MVNILARDTIYAISLHLSTNSLKLDLHRELTMRMIGTACRHGSVCGRGKMLGR